MAQQRWTDEAKAAFLTRLAETGNISEAARLAGMARSSAYRLKASDADFASQWADAEMTAVDALEAEARRRAVEGVERPVIRGGEIITTIRQYSDRLLEFLLRARRPELYRPAGGDAADDKPLSVDETLQRIMALLDDQADADQTIASSSAASSSGFARKGE